MNITVFTSDFADNNMDELKRRTDVGNLAPLAYEGVTLKKGYKFAPQTSWNESETTTLVDGTEVIMNLELNQAMKALRNGTIEAITFSISHFRKVDKTKPIKDD